MTDVARKRDLLAVVSVVLWVVAAVSARSLGIWMAIGPTAVVLGAAVLVLDRRGVAPLLAPRAKLVLVGVVAGFLMAAVTHLLYPPVSALLPFIATDTAVLYAAFRAPSVALASVSLVVVILGEDLVWRGVVQGALVRRLGSWQGVVAAAAVYALAHAPLGSPLLVLVAFACGLAWGIMRASTGSLITPLIAHLLWDVLVLLWLPLDGG